MKTSVALIGFMGVGKSAAGKLLAGRLRKSFVEVDALIEQKAGKPIKHIFRDEGEIRFRELEIEAIKEIAGRRDQVIACGGGVVLNQINIDRLKVDSRIVWLTASPAAIVKRTGMNGEERPILKEINSLKDLESLIRFRKPFYERAADIKINTCRLNINTLVEQILEKLK